MWLYSLQTKHSHPCPSDKFTQVCAWLGTPGQTQPTVKLFDAVFFYNYLYVKNLRHCLPPDNDDQRIMRPDWTRIYFSQSLKSLCKT